ncbi:MAG TPA: hypothetical protein VFT99_04820 [Roseiflexaceae bacterium]|nr:hypothetical protein [Roseiflexaceae bacterium]
MESRNRPSFTLIFGQLLLFVLIGIPLVSYLWETLNQLLGLHFDVQRFLISIVILAVLGGVLYIFSRQLNRLVPPDA